MKNKIFYIQILLVISSIILTLCYHLVYIAYQHSIEAKQYGYLMYFGIQMHGSFFIDLVLYLLIFNLIILMLLIIEEKIRNLDKRLNNG